MSAIFKDNPVLTEAPIQTIRLKCLDKLKWLNEAYGRAQYVTWMNDTGKTKIPVAFIGNGEYESLMPDDKRGNFMWVDIYDTQEISSSPGEPCCISTKGALIFWFNLKSIYPTKEHLMLEEVKRDILNVIGRSGIGGYGSHMTITGVSERPDSIYKGTSLDLVYNSFTYASDNIKNLLQQYFIFPYGALRFEFELTVKGYTLC